MSRNRSIVLFILAFAGATSIFWLVIHQISGLWLDVAVRPEVTSALRESLDDQKKLRALDGAHRDDYRRRFDTNARLLHRLEVIRMSREEMLRRFELVFVALFAIVAAGAALALWSRMRHAQAAERRRYLDLVSTLQETARRHAHEFKGPLTAARLDLDHLADALHGGADESEIAAAIESVNNELEALARFTRQYMTFAAIGTPLVQRLSLRAAVDEFCATFGGAWPGVRLLRRDGDGIVCADRDMLRQVLVNLCTNSARAITANGVGTGSVTFSIQRHGRLHALDVTDDGRGVAESLRERVFDPYVTTQNPGDGMGLGLAISRKIMLDHGGDLQLLSTSANGTTFRILFGDQTCS